MKIIYGFMNIGNTAVSEDKSINIIIEVSYPRYYREFEIATMIYTWTYGG